MVCCNLHSNYHFYVVVIIMNYYVDRCLTNIATGNHAETGLVLPAIPSMIMILSSDNYDKDSIALKEQICWTIGNIAGY